MSAEAVGKLLRKTKRRSVERMSGNKHARKICKKIWTGAIGCVEKMLTI